MSAFSSSVKNSRTLLAASKIMRRTSVFVASRRTWPRTNELCVQAAMFDWAFDDSWAPRTRFVFDLGVISTKRIIKTNEPSPGKRRPGATPGNEPPKKGSRSDDAPMFIPSGDPGQSPMTVHISSSIYVHGHR